MSTPAGWYPQPDGQQRYWDGEDWSEDGASDASTPVAGPASGGEPDRSPKKRPKRSDFRQAPCVYRAYDSMKRAALESTFGQINAKVECPQCHNTGAVAVTSVWQKVGVSGGKATGAVLTGGVSLVATGLSRKQKVSQAHCGDCGSDWTF
jgi:Protein of unknown function (DUF2510)